MSTTETELHERITVDGADEGTRKLERFAAGAGRVASAFEGIKLAAAAAVGFRALGGLTESVQEVQRLYAAVGRVKAVTGMTASNAHAMFDEFELSGVEMEQAEAVMVRLARLSGKMGEGVGESAEQAQHLQNLMTKIGVTIKAGPQQRLEEMAKAAQKGKLGINDLMTVFNMPRSSAAQMMAMLKQGPDRLKQIQAQTLAGADLIDDKALESFQHMQQAKRELKDAWGDLVGLLYKTMLPAITAVIKAVRSGLDTITPVIEKIGSLLAHHMTTVIALTKTWLALFTVNKVIGMFGGGAMSTGGRLMQAGRFAMGFLGSKAAVPIAGPVPLAMASRGIASLGMMSAGGGPAGIIGKILSSTVGKIGVIGAIVGVIAAVFSGIMKNSHGIRDTFKALFEKIGALFERLRPLFETLMGIVSKIAEFLGDKIIWVVDKLIWALGKLVDLVSAIADGLESLGKKMMSDKGPWSYVGNLLGMTPGMQKFVNDPENQRLAKMAEDAEKKARDAETKKDEPPNQNINQDFRGSKFEITNNFPKDVDGGRVSVVFADELAALGERRVDSGLRPLFSYR